MDVTLQDTDSSLPLLMTGILTDDAHNPLASDDSTFVADLFYRCTHLHDLFS